MEYDVRPWRYIQVSHITFLLIVVFFVKFCEIYTNLRHWFRCLDKCAKYLKHWTISHSMSHIVAKCVPDAHDNGRNIRRASSQTCIRCIKLANNFFYQKHPCEKHTSRAIKIADLQCNYQLNIKWSPCAR